jgi:hypothetical protein
MNHHRVVGHQKNGAAATGPDFAQRVNALVSSFQEVMRKRHTLIAGMSVFETPHS